MPTSPPRHFCQGLSADILADLRDVADSNTGRMQKKNLDKRKTSGGTFGGPNSMMRPDGFDSDKGSTRAGSRNASKDIMLDFDLEGAGFSGRSPLKRNSQSSAVSSVHGSTPGSARSMLGGAESLAYSDPDRAPCRLQPKQVENLKVKFLEYLLTARANDIFTFKELQSIVRKDLKIANHHESIELYSHLDIFVSEMLYDGRMGSDRVAAGTVLYWPVVPAGMDLKEDRPRLGLLGMIAACFGRVKQKLNDRGKGGQEVKEGHGYCIKGRDMLRIREHGGIRSHKYSLPRQEALKRAICADIKNNTTKGAEGGSKHRWKAGGATKGL